jgi:hypothetical protein
MNTDKATRISQACREVNEVARTESMLRFESKKRETEQVKEICTKYQVPINHIKNVTKV